MRLKCEVGCEKIQKSSVGKKRNYFPNNPIELDSRMIEQSKVYHISWKSSSKYNKSKKTSYERKKKRK